MTRDGTTRAPNPDSVLTLALALILLALPTLAHAHPFGERFYAHRIVLRAREGALGIQYSTELPAATVMRRFAREVAGLEDVGPEQDRAFTERMLKEMAEGLSVLVSGEAVQVAWGPMEGQPSGVGTGEFFAYHLEAEIPVTWTDEPLEILVTNNNALDWPAYFSGWIFAEDGVAVAESSLAGMGEAAAGDDVFQLQDAWSRDPIYRDVAAAFTTAGPTPPETPAPEPTDPHTRQALIWLAAALLAGALMALAVSRLRAAR